MQALGALVCGWHRQLVQELASGPVDRRRGVSAFVGVDADRDHCLGLRSLLSWIGSAADRTGLRGAGSYLVTPSILERDGRHDPLGQPKRRRDNASQPAALRTLGRSVDVSYRLLGRHRTTR